MKALRRTWRRGGLPGFGTTPPVSPVPAQRAASDEDMERLAGPGDRFVTERQLGALRHPNIGEGAA